MFKEKCLFGVVISMIMTSVMHTVDGCLYVECVCMCVHVCCCLMYTRTAGVLRLSSTSTDSAARKPRYVQLKSLH